MAAAPKDLSFVGATSGGQSQSYKGFRNISGVGGSGGSNGSGNTSGTAAMDGGGNGWADEELDDLLND